MSVGSVTITPARAEVLDFTQSYYYTPAQMAVMEGSDITSLEDLAGATICVGESTTYQFWLEGTLELPDDAGSPAPLPEGAEVVTLPTDINCPEAWRDGRDDFEGWLSSITTVDGAIARWPAGRRRRRSGLQRGPWRRLRQGRDGQRLARRRGG